MQADFSGYATKTNTLCADGRTIMPGAFTHQDKTTVPLVWQHNHKSIEEVLGHAVLEDREDGTYIYAYLNDSPKAKHAKVAIEHGDINRLSIHANQLIERGKKVFHGAIKEVSLVLAGANPGAVIDNITIRHSDGDETYLEEEAIIHTGLEIEHEQPEVEEQASSDLELTHAEDEDGATPLEIYEGMTDDQKKVVHYMIGQALAAGEEVAEDEQDDNDNEVKQDNVGDSADDTISHDNTDKEGSDMTTRNIFEGDKTAEDTGYTLTHSDMAEIMQVAQDTGRLSRAVRSFASDHLEHGIQNIDILFPEARAVTGTPEWQSREMGWVTTVLNGVKKLPYSRIKSWTADITYEEARAKGYVKGSMKQEEYFSVAKRETHPKTIYKKQKLDRDDIIDITDFDVVVWMKGEMRVMLNEEIARAILLGDGRAIDDPDKIDEDKIRPIATDDPFYSIPVMVNVDDASSNMEEVLDAMLLSREQYKGTGSPTFFTTQSFIARCRLLRDEQGRKLFPSTEALREEMEVSSIVTVEALNEYPDILGILVNLSDYSTGTDRGGEINFFDDFDIDFNQEKYLLETRLSGCLTKPASAMVYMKTDESTDAAAIPTKPVWDSAEGVVTIPTITGIEYRDGDGDVLAPGDVVVTPGTNITVTAWAIEDYYIPAGYQTRWTYLATPDAGS